MQPKRDFSFGRFRLDTANECLWEGTRAIALRPKAFAVLKLLLEHSGQLLTKQRVLEEVWPGTFVTDGVLKDSIRQLREALGDDAESPTYIETAHRRGYRFIAKIAEDPTTAASLPKAASHDPGPQVEPVDAELPSRAKEDAVLGRETEIGKLWGWFERARSGKRQTVFVTGEPGIGKTTLVQALIQRAALIPGVLVARGQCLEQFGAGEAYMPVFDAFSRLCRSPDGEQVLDLLRHHAPAWLAQMPSAVPPSERSVLQSQAAGTTRERMLREMAEAIEALAAKSPLVLVLEDLHWSDYSTLDLVSYLARRDSSARLMVIATYRPVDVIVGDHPLKSVKRELHAHGFCHEVALECLSPEAVGEYLNGRFAGHRFPARLQRIIFRRTEGNPLFMVNLVEYLIDREIMVEEQGTWKLREDVSELEQGVPASLRQLIEMRIERLSPEERTVLEGASVAGMECSSVAIAAGLDMPIEWVEKHCEELARRHQFLSPAVLVGLPDGTITPRHRFVHVLYCDVPYRLMPPMRRSQIHHRIAERGVVIYGDRTSEIANELAMHFEQSRDWPSAVDYLLLAAGNAAARSAHHESIDLANRGLDALKLLPETAEDAKKEMKLRMILSASLMAIKGFASPEAEKINASGRELFWRHGPSTELFYMLWSLNMYQQFSGNMEASLEIASQLTQLAEDLQDGALIMEAQRSLGAALVMAGRSAEALEHLEKTAEFYAVHRDHSTKVFTGGFDNKVMVECFVALSLLELGDLDQSAERLAAGLALTEELNHPQTSVVAWHAASQIHQLRGEASLAYERAKAAMELAEEYGLMLWVTYGLMELGWAVAELGNAREGIEMMQRGLAEYEATGAKLRSQYFLALLADQLGKAGRVEEGLVAIAKAAELARSTGEGYALAELHRIHGELWVKSSEVDEGKPSQDARRAKALSEALACFDEAIAVAKERGTKTWELRAALSKHRVDQMLGNFDLTQLAEIYARFKEGFETADLQEAKALLGATEDYRARG